MLRLKGRAMSSYAIIVCGVVAGAIAIWQGWMSSQFTVDGAVGIVVTFLIYRLVSDEESRMRRTVAEQRRRDANGLLAAVHLELKHVMLGYVEYHKGITGAMLPQPAIIHQLWRYRDAIDPDSMQLLEDAYIKYSRYTRGQNDEAFTAIHEAIDRIDEHLKRGVPGRLTTSDMDKAQNIVNNF